MLLKMMRHESKSGWCLVVSFCLFVCLFVSLFVYFFVWLVGWLVGFLFYILKRF